MGAYAVIGIFAWAGIPFALLGAYRGWTKPVTYLGGGLLAMATGVASLFALSFLQSEFRYGTALDGKALASAVYNAGQLLALGIFPGLAAGLTFWLVAVPKRQARPV